MAVFFGMGGTSPAPYFYGTQTSGKDVIAQLAPVDRDIRLNFGDAAMAELSRWNVRSILTDSGAFPPLVRAARREGFVDTWRADTRLLLTSSRPGSMFNNQTRDVGLIGVAATEYWSKFSSIP